MDAELLPLSLSLFKAQTILSNLTMSGIGVWKIITMNEKKGRYTLLLFSNWNKLT